MNSVVSSFLDSGGGLVLSMVCFSPSIKSLHYKLLLVLNSENKFIIAKLMMCVVWCMMNVYVFTKAC